VVDLRRSDRRVLARRSLFKLGLGALGAGLAAPGFALADSDAAPAPDMRSISLDNLHTGEKLRAVFWADGDYIPDVLDAVNLHLRDYRTGDIHPIDPRLLDLLDALASSADAGAPFQVISGYRSPATNAMLRERSEEVAKKSFHMQGMAIDIRLPGRDLSQLHLAALGLGRGGVGYYPESDFIHVDVGPVREWRGL
jgi:uncharacterized protein YcbK (DUF882 family)